MCVCVHPCVCELVWFGQCECVSAYVCLCILCICVVSVCVFCVHVFVK